MNKYLYLRSALGLGIIVAFLLLAVLSPSTTKQVSPPINPTTGLVDTALAIILIVWVALSLVAAAMMFLRESNSYIPGLASIAYALMYLALSATPDDGAQYTYSSLTLITGHLVFFVMPPVILADSFILTLYGWYQRRHPAQA